MVSPELPHSGAGESRVIEKDAHSIWWGYHRSSDLVQSWVTKTGASDLF